MPWPCGYKTSFMLNSFGILTLISIINTSETLEARILYFFKHFSFYKQLEFHAQFS